MSKQITKQEAIHSLAPDLSFNLYPDGKIELTKIDGQENTGVIPSEEAITTEMERLQAEYDARAYVRKRVTEYPAIGDQLDALFHAGVFPAEMAAVLQAVKDKYPKSE